MHPSNAPPAWSMGKQQRSTEKRQDRDYKGVSPGSYAIHAQMPDKKQEPKYSIGAKYPHGQKSLEVPGAGSYNLPSKLIESPGKSIGAKTQIKSLSGVLGPGPGGYSADKQKRGDLKYSMGGKLKDIAFDKKNFQPGPGNYSADKPNSIPSMKFGSGSRSHIGGTKEDQMKPGPGAFNQDKQSILNSAPKFGFGSGTREEIASKLKVPGPGSYGAKNMIGRDGPSTSMGAITSYTPHIKEQAAKPGPGAYSPDKNPSQKREPAFKMGTGMRQDLATEKQRGFQTSPGQYNPNTDGTKQNAAQWRFGSENRPGLVTKGHGSQPGPNSYSIPSRLNEGPKVHMHARTDLVDQNKKKNIPGPGSYNLQDARNPNQAHAARFSIGTGSRIAIGGGKEALSKPGPGNYESNTNTKKNAPKYGFGSMTRPNIVRGNSTSPAPGSYNHRTLIGADGPSKTLSPKLTDKYAEKQARQQPGPGQYEFHLKAMKTAPNYGMGTEKREVPGSKYKTPDPGHYNPDQGYTKTKAPGYKIGSEQRDTFDNKRNRGNPGPGNYPLTAGAFRQKPQFYMGVKLGEQSKLNVPGAGTYEPQGNSVQKTGPGYSMGVKLKSELVNKEGVPGPGQYTGSNENVKQAAPKYGFGSSKRTDLKTDGSPGPGHYYIPVKVADVPDYNMPSRPMPEYKYV